MQERRTDSPPSPGSPVTVLLLELGQGDESAFGELLPLVYDELHGLAHGRLRGERAGHTLNTTALVHEAYLKLVDQTRVQWQNRAHFFAIASMAMRRILINYAEARSAAKRGGGVEPVTFVEELQEMTDERADELLALDEALRRLERFNERGAMVVQYRFFGGLTYDEIASVLDVSPITVRRAWSAARAWLRRELQGDVLSTPIE